MGLLDRLRGTSSGQLLVTVQPPAAGPGSELTVRVDVREGPDDKARALRVGVTCTGHYLVERRDRDRDGSVDTDRVWRSVPLHEEERTLDLRRGEQVAQLVLPEHAQPSSVDVVAWEAWAVVDRAHGIDVVERVPFEVRIPLAQVPATRGPDTTANGLTLWRVPTAAAQGDVLSGGLVIEVAQRVKARAVSVRLHRRVTYTAEALNDYDVYTGSLFASLLTRGTSRITDDSQVAEVDLDGEGTFEPGQRRTLEYAISVPPAGPTASHPYAQVDWRLEAVLDRRLRGDVSVETPLIVV